VRDQDMPMTRSNTVTRTPISAAQNFRLAPDGNHGIDFGNCCRHWYCQDLAISLSTLRRIPTRARWKNASWRLHVPPARRSIRAVVEPLGRVPSALRIGR
jgi:hypothetical protein